MTYTVGAPTPEPSPEPTVAPSPPVFTGDLSGLWQALLAWLFGQLRMPTF